MLKIALLGVDSGHFDVFSELITKHFQEKFLIVAIWGEDYTQAHSKTKALQLDPKLIYKNLDEAIQNIDVAMIIGRFAESHAQPAIKCLSKKIPVFIDKPVANSSRELQEIIKISSEFNTPFESFSIYRFSSEVLKAKSFLKNKDASSVHLTGPRYCKDLVPDPRFQDIYFYGIHSVEIFLETIGNEIVKIQNNISKKSIHSILSLSDGTTGIINFANDLEREFYLLNIVTNHGVFHQEIKYDPYLYNKALEHLFKFFKTHKKLVSTESSVMGLKILDQIRSEDHS